MQFTFTLGRDTTPAEYHRLIAALVVLGDVTVPEGDAEREMLPSAHGSMSGGPSVSNLPRTDRSEPAAPPMFTPEELAEADRLIAAEQPAPPPPPPAPPAVDPQAIGFGATPPAPPAPADTADLDAEGLPWDERIHAGTKAMNADGTWRRRRNLDPDVLASVTAELRQAHPAAPAPAASAPPPPPPPAPPAPPAPTAAPTTPVELIHWAARNGKTPAQCAEACQRIGLVDAEGKGALTMILDRPEMVAPLLEALR